jgi:uncharacterized membrane protein YuzA (DUF378 family)
MEIIYYIIGLGVMCLGLATFAIFADKVNKKQKGLPS